VNSTIVGGNVEFDWSGVQAQLLVTSTTSYVISTHIYVTLTNQPVFRVSVTLNDTNNFYNVFLNDEHIAVIMTLKNKAEYLLVSNLDPEKQYYLKLTKRTEAMNNNQPTICYFFSLDSGGQLLELPPAPSRKLEFLGDSITCGYGNMANSSSCADITVEGVRENNYLTYGQMLGRYYNGL
jgi:hypothetical protein